MNNELDYKNDIVATRKGGLSSSDAKMIARCGTTGETGASARLRIAQMLGLEERKDFSTPYTELGDTIENSIFRALQKAYGDKIASNPYYKSEKLSKKYGFDVFNHIDYEITDGDKLTWIENKAVMGCTAKVLSEYIDQLRFHKMLLDEKASSLGLRPMLVLSHYDTTDFDRTFDIGKWTTTVVNHGSVERNDMLLKGLDVISAALKDFRWEGNGSASYEMLPSEARELCMKIADMERKSKECVRQMEQFKEKMLSVMTEKNIKSIKNDSFTITRIDASMFMSFDSSKYKSEHPEWSERYGKETKHKASVMFKLKE